eukprot:TRINITY_DN864_c0_g2_i1.p3 TRINITY_DN864_c0_g2~~TRINITY_DN864_c0_g2_i1.p3  ORF type:complete len:102 (+),score=7.56 TRINITY_DN864_c0_g2_i1:54-359(+)
MESRNKHQKWYQICASVSRARTSIIAQSPPPQRNNQDAQAVTAKRRIGKLLSRVFCLAVFAVFCSTFKARRRALVFFGRRSRGWYFLPLYCFLASVFCFWL